MTGKELKEFRKKLNLTQADFGKLVGIGVKLISKWETNPNKDIRPYAANVIKSFNTPNTTAIEIKLLKLLELHNEQNAIMQEILSLINTTTTKPTTKTINTKTKNA